MKKLSGDGWRPGMADAHTTLGTNALSRALIKADTKVGVDEELRSAISVHGIYRPAPESARAVDALVRGGRRQRMANSSSSGAGVRSGSRASTRTRP